MSGRLCGNLKGFAFVSLSDGGQDVFVSPDARAGAIHGDQVEISISNTRHDGRRDGVVERIISPSSTWIGSLVKIGSYWCLSPKDPKYCWMALPQDNETIGLLEESREGDWAVVEVRGGLPWQSEVGFRQAIEVGAPLPNVNATLVATCGKSNNARDLSLVIAASRGLVKDFSSLVQEDAERASSLSLSQLPWSLKDMTAVPFVTIDGKGTRDFDDAVYAKALDDGTIELMVAVADVAAYVDKGSALDIEARRRGTSVYLPGCVLPMLPLSISEDSCSLVPQKERSALVVSMKISVDGEMSGIEFVAAKIKSHARLTYDGVSKLLDFGKGPKGPIQVSKLVSASLFDLDLLTSILLSSRQRRGALDFDRQEHSLYYNAAGSVAGVVHPDRTRAHRLIEECMVQANVAAAQFLNGLKLPYLSRNHAPPLLEKLAPLLAHAPNADVSSPLGIASLLSDQPHLMPFVRLSLGSATYSPEQGGHFGLALPEYAHFTSPIRRYPDLLVHRAIHVALGHLPESSLDDDWASLGFDCTASDRNAAFSSRIAMDILRLQWLSGLLENDPSQVFSAQIDGATPAGVFLTLEKNGASGLLRPPPSSTFDSLKKTWTLDGGQVWNLGDKFEVMVSSVDIEGQRLLFDLPKLTPQPKVRMP